MGPTDQATPIQLGHGKAVLELREIWNFGGSYHRGVVEGLMEWCNVEGRVAAEVLSPCNCDLHLDWMSTTSIRPTRHSSAPPPP